MVPRTLNLHVHVDVYKDDVQTVHTYKYKYAAYRTNQRLEVYVPLYIYMSL